MTQLKRETTYVECKKGLITIKFGGKKHDIENSYPK